MTITDSLIPKNKYNRPGTKSTPKRICVHYTGDCGATAAQLAKYWQNVAAGVFKDKSWSWTSAQYIVGLDGEIVRCVPDNEIAYAAANQNADTIHIEVCYKQKSGAFEEKSIAALRELVGYLMDKYSIPVRKVVRHYDLTGKQCPAYYVDENRWAALHERITSESKSSALYRVQVGAFGNRDNAESYAARIRQAGFRAFVIQVK